MSRVKIRTQHLSEEPGRGCRDLRHTICLAIVGDRHNRVWKSVDATIHSRQISLPRAFAESIGLPQRDLVSRSFGHRDSGSHRSVSRDCHSARSSYRVRAAAVWNQARPGVKPGRSKGRQRTRCWQLGVGRFNRANHGGSRSEFRRLFELPGHT